MEIIPAIDIKDGRCVRLKQGDFKQQKIYDNDPVKIAQYWENNGAPRIHIVDLDGARKGRPVNYDLIFEIIENLAIPIQVGGGIRKLSTIKRYINQGAERVILGTVVLENQRIVRKALNYHGADKIVVGIDIKDKKVAVKGWTETAEIGVTKLLNKMVELGLKNFIITDIKKDGMLSGPNIPLFADLNLGQINLIASGGITTKQDLEELKSKGIDSVIIGKALYEGRLNIEEIFKL